MNLLTSYFKRELTAAGFHDDLCVEWSLSYCQGDGMAFYGELSFDDLINLGRKMYANQKRKQNKFVKLVSTIEGCDYHEFFEIYRNGFGYHYSHAYTMDVSICAAEDLSFFDDANQCDWYFKKAKKAEYMALWDDFILDLEQYIRDVSKKLASAGYRILDAAPSSDEMVYQFDTAHYRVELIRSPMDWDCFEEDESTMLCEEILEQNIQFADFTARIKDKATGIVLGDESCGFITYAQNDRTFGGMRQCLIREAIDNTRAHSSLIARQAKLMQKHLA